MEIPLRSISARKQRIFCIVYSWKIWVQIHFFVNGFILDFWSLSTFRLELKKLFLNRWVFSSDLSVGFSNSFISCFKSSKIFFYHIFFLERRIQKCKERYCRHRQRLDAFVLLASSHCLTKLFDGKV